MSLVLEGSLYLGYINPHSQRNITNHSTKKTSFVPISYTFIQFFSKISVQRSWYTLSKCSNISLSAETHSNLHSRFLRPRVFEIHDIIHTNPRLHSNKIDPAVREVASHTHSPAESRQSLPYTEAVRWIQSIRSPLPIDNPCHTPVLCISVISRHKDSLRNKHRIIERRQCTPFLAFPIPSESSSTNS